MPKLKDLLHDLEAAQITSHSFIKAKVEIQDGLYRMTESVSDPVLNQAIVSIYTKWRKLGGDAGTLQGYLNAIADLKIVLDSLPADTSTN